jgi:hypothetical protein
VCTSFQIVYGCCVCVFIAPFIPKAKLIERRFENGYRFAKIDANKRPLHHLWEITGQLAENGFWRWEIRII